jgi:hypothetical protein
VKHSIATDTARSWIVDYSAARARAIQWLGDRYLLAKPINVSDTAWRRGTSANAPSRTER